MHSYHIVKCSKPLIIGCLNHCLRTKSWVESIELDLHIAKGVCQLQFYSQVTVLYIVTIPTAPEFDGYPNGILIGINIFSYINVFQDSVFSSTLQVGLSKSQIYLLNSHTDAKKMILISSDLYHDGKFAQLLKK